MQTISPDSYFDQDGRTVLLDVRSPAEYADGHIRGALSLPLFSNDERAAVGTLYKQSSPDAALLYGLDIAGAKMRPLVERARELAPAGRVTVYCWRGGQRSRSLGWLLEQTGMDVQQMIGGYKAYRAFARQWLSVGPLNLRVLSGPTGSGKTAILMKLKNLGCEVVDLEALANHKGSSFGALGEDPQPSSEEFENLLFDALRKIPAGKRVWIEDESRMIGTVCQPEVFYQRLFTAPSFAMVQPIEWRVKNLVTAYADYPKQDLAAAFQRLSRKLGGQHLQTALGALEADDFATACRIALVYYDKTYNHYANQKGRPATRVVAESHDAAAIARQLVELP